MPPALWGSGLSDSSPEKGAGEAKKRALAQFHVQFFRLPGFRLEFTGEIRFGRQTRGAIGNRDISKSRPPRLRTLQPGVRFKESRGQLRRFFLVEDDCRAMLDPGITQCVFVVDQVVSRTFRDAAAQISSVSPVFFLSVPPRSALRFLSRVCCGLNCPRS